MKTLQSFITLLSLATLWFACSTSKMKSIAPEPEVSPSTENQSIDIDYLLGRTRYHLVMGTKNGIASGKNELDRRVISEGRFSQTQFMSFKSRILKFIVDSKKSPQNEPSSADEDLRCQSPFVVKVNDAKGLVEIRGCRSTDDGTFSRLVRDGEFLLYSKD